MSLEHSVMNTGTLQRMGSLLLRHQRKILVFAGLFLTVLGLYLGVSPRGYGASTYSLGIWCATTGLFLGIRKRYATIMLAIGILLALGYWYNSPLVLANFGVGIIISAVSLLLHANNQKKTRQLPLPKPPFMAITLVAILALGMLSPLGTVHLTSAASAKFVITILPDGEVRCELGDSESRYDILIQDNKSIIEYSLTASNESAQEDAQMDVNENGWKYITGEYDDGGKIFAKPKDPLAAEQ